MNTKFILSHEILKENTIVFFSNNANEIESLKEIAVKELQKLVNAFLAEKNLSKRSIYLFARTKTLKSSLEKLAYKGWPQFDHLPDVISDLIGIRIICWYLDDCYGIEKYLKQSDFFKILKIEDYINQPKKSGYRAIHLTSTILDSALMDKWDMPEIPSILPFNFEIQIRTRLQDTWGEISHEYYYRSKTTGMVNRKYHDFLAKSSLRLHNEDVTFNKFKLIWEILKDDNGR